MVDVSGSRLQGDPSYRRRLIALMTMPSAIAFEQQGASPASDDHETGNNRVGPRYATLRARQGRAIDRVLEFVTRNPGTHKAAICAATGLKVGTVSNQLVALQRREKIHVRRLGSRMVVFPAIYSAIELQALPALHQGLGPRLAIELTGARGRHVPQLAIRLGVAAKTVGGHLALYQNHGLAVPDASGKWHATALLRRLVGK